MSAPTTAPVTAPPKHRNSWSALSVELRDRFLMACEDRGIAVVAPRHRLDEVSR